MRQSATITNNIKGIENQIDFTTPATNKLKVRALRNFVAAEEMNQTELRQYLDKMDPLARAGLVVALDALEAAITNV